MANPQSLPPDIIDLHGRWLAGTQAIAAADGALTWRELSDEAWISGKFLRRELRASHLPSAKEQA